MAHSVGQVQTTKYFGPATVKTLRARALVGTPAFQVGDIVEYIVQFTPVSNGANNGANGYLTDYIPSGTEVVQASFVQLAGYDGVGDAIFNDVSPSAPGQVNTGWGGSGRQTYLAGSAFKTSANFDYTGNCASAGYATDCNGRLSELYGDTGIFFSTDSRTAQNPSLPTRMKQGDPTNGYLLNGVTRANQLTGIIGETSNTVHNLWDACMAVAFGGATVTGCNAAIRTNNGAGSGAGQTPYLTGSAVAGPQTGYPLDYNGTVGPWQRIQYAGSRIGDVTLGPARNISQTAPLSNSATGFTATTPLPIAAGGIPSSAGYPLSANNPLPANTNAVRWAVGKLTVGQINYVKISLRITQPLGPAGVTNGSEVFGGDASDLTGTGTAGTLDSPWPYLVPSVADNNSNLYISKKACSYDPTATNCVPLGGTTVAANSTVTYQIIYLNTGNADQTNVQLLDVLPCQVPTSATGMKIGAATGPIALTLPAPFPSTPYTTQTTAGTNCGATNQTRNTVAFAPIATMGPGVGGSLIVNIASTNATVGATQINSAVLQSAAVTPGVVSNAVTFVGSTTTNANPSLSISKSTSTPSVVAGGTAQYTIAITNTGVSPVTTLTIADILPTAGGSPDPTTRFNYGSTVSVQSSGLTTATQLITSTTTAAAYTPATALSPYGSAAGAANAVVANWYFGNSTLAAGGVVTLTFTVSVGSNVPASATPYTNSARAILGTTTNSPLTYSIDAGNVAGITVSSPLSLSKTLACYYSGASCVAPNASGNIPNNARVRYNVAYANTANLGTAAINNVVVTDTLPCQISASTGPVTMTAVSGPIPQAFSTATANTGNCPGTVQTLTLGSTSALAAGASGSFSFEVQLSTPSNTSSVVTNAANITGTAVAPASAQVQNSVVNVANLQVSKTANPTSVLPGGTLSYTITIVNTGTAPASTLTVYDWLPTGTSTVADTTRRFSYTATATVSGAATAFSSVTVNSPPTQAPYSTGTYRANQQELVFAFPPTLSIPVGGTLSIAVPVYVGTNLPTLNPPNYYYNNAAASYNNGLSAASNAATANVSLYAVLSVSKTDGVTSVAAGGNTTYTLNFSNAGPSAADGAVVKDVPSAGLNCSSVSCTATSGGASCPSGMSGTPSNVPGFFSTGVAIPTFPANSSVTLSVVCGVTATGQ